MRAGISSFFLPPGWIEAGLSDLSDLGDLSSRIHHAPFFHDQAAATPHRAPPFSTGWRQPCYPFDSSGFM